MAYDREGYAPWSLTRKAGVQSATVDGDIKVPQYIQPVLDTGFVDEKGDWKGTKSSDEVFIAFDSHLAIPNSGVMLTPQAVSDNVWPLDMTGYNDVIIAIKPNNGGAVKIDAVMGPDSHSFANLSPVDAAKRIEIAGRFDVPASLQTAFYDSAQTLTADVWNIFLLQGMLANQKLLQFKVTNTDLGESNFEFAFMRIV